MIYQWEYRYSGSASLLDHDFLKEWSEFKNVEIGPYPKREWRFNGELCLWEHDGWQYRIKSDPLVAAIVAVTQSLQTADTPECADQRPSHTPQVPGRPETL